jgi:plasmid stabilization system protein ParE
MAEVRLREEAEADLVAYAGKLRSAIDLLERHPQAGPLIESIEPPAHCLVRGRHRILYDLEGEVIWVLRILHVARGLENWRES